MGGGARNHGGTRGHGYSPQKGERPNFNIHTLSDKTLLKLVNSKGKELKVPNADQKVSVIEQFPKISRDHFPDKDNEKRKYEKPKMKKVELNSKMVQHDKSSQQKIGTPVFNKQIPSDPKFSHQVDTKSSQQAVKKSVGQEESESVKTTPKSIQKDDNLQKTPLDPKFCQQVDTKPVQQVDLKTVQQVDPRSVDKVGPKSNQYVDSKLVQKQDQQALQSYQLIDPKSAKKVDKKDSQQMVTKSSQQDCGKFGQKANTNSAEHVDPKSVPQDVSKHSQQVDDKSNHQVCGMFWKPVDPKPDQQDDTKSCQEDRTNTFHQAGSKLVQQVDNNAFQQSETSKHGTAKDNEPSNYCPPFPSEMIPLAPKFMIPTLVPLPISDLQLPPHPMSMWPLPFYVAPGQIIVLTNSLSAYPNQVSGLSSIPEDTTSCCSMTSMVPNLKQD